MKGSLAAPDKRNSPSLLQRVIRTLVSVIGIPRTDESTTPNFLAPNFFQKSLRELTNMYINTVATASLMAILILVEYTAGDDCVAQIRSTLPAVTFVALVTQSLFTAFYNTFGFSLVWHGALASILHAVPHTTTLWFVAAALFVVTNMMFLCWKEWSTVAAHVCAMAGALGLTLGLSTMGGGGGGGGRAPGGLCTRGGGDGGGGGAPGVLWPYALAVTILGLLVLIPLVLLCPLIMLLKKIVASRIRGQLGRAARADAFPSPQDAEAQPAETRGQYDYIIVGGGSAGCVLARRLAAKHTVLLLEAGGNRDSIKLHLPAAALGVMETDYDWGLLTQPQPGLSNVQFDDAGTGWSTTDTGRTLLQCRGCVLGGCSALNLCIWNRGHPKDFDWSADWSYDSLAPYFTKAEEMLSSPTKLGVGRVSAAARTFLKACGSILGIPDDSHRSPPTTTPRSKHPAVSWVGATTPHLTVGSDGTRVSHDYAYLHSAPADVRSRITVLTNAYVTKVRIEDGRATGVEFYPSYKLKQTTPDGTSLLKMAHARREVILSAGTIHSPQLLMMSGVGAEDHLRKYGIDVVQPLSGVGANLQDYQGTGVVCTQKQPSWDKEIRSFGALANYAVLGGGPFSTTSIEAIAYAPSTHVAAAETTGATDPVTQRPRMQLFFQNTLFPFAPVGPFAQYVEGAEAGTLPDAFTVHCCLTQPESRGWVRLKPMDESSPRCEYGASPGIQQNYLTAPNDLRDLVDALKAARAVAADMCSEGMQEILPGPTVQTDEQLEAYVKASACHFFGNLVGTCKMGPEADGGVVDPYCRVHGIGGLRVVDASVIPHLLSAQPNATVTAIAERMADLILAET